jgi:hypothetical protein
MSDRAEHQKANLGWKPLKVIPLAALLPCLFASLLMAFSVWWPQASHQYPPFPTWAWWMAGAIAVLGAVVSPAVVIGTGVPRPDRFIEGFWATVLGWYLGLVGMLFTGIVIAKLTWHVMPNDAWQGIGLWAFGLTLLGCMTAPIVGSAAVVVGWLRDRRQASPDRVGNVAND